MVAIDQSLEKVMPIELGHFKGFYSFLHFFLSAYRYVFDIWYIALPYQI
jgi:hypothetical protein